MLLGLVMALEAVKPLNFLFLMVVVLQMAMATGLVVVAAALMQLD
jgi:hypothetical protein